MLAFDTSELERQLLDKRAERDSAQKELEKKQTDLRDRAPRPPSSSLAEAEARQRKAQLKVDVPAELVASKDLAKSREDLDLARREVAYLKDRLRLETLQSNTETESLARKRDRAAGRVAGDGGGHPADDRDRAARRHRGLRRHRRRREEEGGGLLLARPAGARDPRPEPA